MIRRVLLLLFVCGTFLCVQASAQSVDDLIRKHLVARGGLEKIKAVKTLRLTTTLHTDDMKIPLVIQIKRPGLIRGDASVQGVALVRAYDGETAWQINPFEGVKEADKMTGSDADETIELGDIDGPLVDYKPKGNTVELIGKEDFEATPVYKLKVTLKNGNERYIYLDANNFLELKEIARRKQDGKTTDVETVYSNYKPVGGLMIAHAWEARSNGELEEQITIDKIEINPVIDDFIFKMPGKTAEKKPSGR